MGLFSYACAVTNSSIPATASVSVWVVLPDSSRVFGTYDGYGGIAVEYAYDSKGNEVDLDDLNIVFNAGGFDLHCAYGAQLIPGFKTRDDAFDDDNFELIEGSIVMILERNYRHNEYAMYSRSERCPYQGFFYPFDDEEALDRLEDEDWLGEDNVDLKFAYKLAG